MATAQTQPALGVFSAGEVHGKQRNLWVDAARRLSRNRLALFGLAVVAVFIVLAVFSGSPFGTALGRYDPYQYQNYSEINHGPSLRHFFGTDELGHDNWSRVLRGLRVSLSVGFAVAAIDLFIGIAVGTLAALGGRWSDNIVMRATDVAYAFPDLLLIILIQATFGGGLWQVIVAIALVAWTGIARLVRAQMLSLRESDFVMAARTLGASQLRIVVVHILPNTLGPVIVALTFAIPAAIFAEAALSFIGVGLPAPTASLGRLVNDGYTLVNVNASVVLFPALAIGLLMLSFTFIGDGLRDALDPRTRGS
ncbi:MAG TPA: ABC transporter permease [Dehalococcoidia bacterium]|nr:ABC transporter permease [Dehalococcoidia bacterium]